MKKAKSFSRFVVRVVVLGLVIQGAILLGISGLKVSEAQEWLDIQGVNFDIRAGHPRLFFRDQQEWDVFKAKITNPANVDEYIHYQRMKTYVDTYPFSASDVGHWTQAFRWYLSRALVAKVEEGSYKTNFLNWVQGIVDGGRVFSEAKSFIVPLTFDWFYNDLTEEQKQKYVDWILYDS